MPFAPFSAEAGIEVSVSAPLCDVLSGAAVLLVSPPPAKKIGTTVTSVPGITNEYSPAFTCATLIALFSESTAAIPPELYPLEGETFTVTVLPSVAELELQAAVPLSCCIIVTGILEAAYAAGGLRKTRKPLAVSEPTNSADNNLFLNIILYLTFLFTKNLARQTKKKGRLILTAQLAYNRFV